jgi:hypothetical protein
MQYLLVRRGLGRTIASEVVFVLGWARDMDKGRSS